MKLFALRTGFHPALSQRVNRQGGAGGWGNRVLQQGRETDSSSGFSFWIDFAGS